MTVTPATASLAVNATRQLTARCSRDRTGTWTTSDAMKATVSSTGLVTAVGAGTATITFTSTDGGYTATCAVTVTGS
ncbi:Ig-like domain-containing protein [Pantoea sp. VS1]|uniref:Ig-like domain-containing protein n=1 Tax=Pantoea sp. VS1 TaxID=2003658 RepID=UPI0020CBE9B9|nr:Ig-like domain-containing protein [Pantoea sp. VS1]